MRKGLTLLISIALSTVPKVSLLMVFITWVQRGVGFCCEYPWLTHTSLQ